ncbi:MAG: hypothetical protein GX907_00660 [Clostridiaceae bacterium]|nr:hypothetical protein [Clostridiaceae bacterium]
MPGLNGGWTRFIASRTTGSAARGTASVGRETLCLIHAADLHLGSLPQNLGAYAQERREVLSLALERIIGLAEHSQVDLLLLPGDVLESKSLRRDEMKHVWRTLGRVPELPIFIATGNHDPLAADSPWFLPGQPDNVYIFSGEGEVVELSYLNTMVYGASFVAPYRRDPPADLYRTVRPIGGLRYRDFWRIGLIHGEIVADDSRSTEPLSEYNPLRPADIGASGLHYLALGHIHQGDAELRRAGQTYYAYSGCPCGRGMDELGTKFVRRIEIDRRGNCNDEKISLNLPEIRAVEIDMDGVATTAEAAERIAEVLPSGQAGGSTVVGGTGVDPTVLETGLWASVPPREHFYRLVLIGSTHPDYLIQTDGLLLRLRENYDFKILKLINRAWPKFVWRERLKDKTFSGYLARVCADALERAERSGDAEAAVRTEAAIDLLFAAANGQDVRRSVTERS